VWKDQSENDNMNILRSQSLSGAHLKRTLSVLLPQQLIRLEEKEVKQKANRLSIVFLVLVFKGRNQLLSYGVAYWEKFIFI